MREEEIQQRIRRRLSRRVELLTFDIPDLIEDVEGCGPEQVVGVMTGWVIGLPWEELGRDACVSLVGYLGARGRAAVHAHPELEHEVWYLFHKLKARILEPHRVYVHGLSLEHEPQTLSWSADARFHADALLSMLCVASSSSAVEPRGASRSASGQGEQREPWESRTLEGKDVYVVGGARRHHTLRALYEVTGASRVIWYEVDLKGGMGKVRSLARRVVGQTPGAVFLITSLVSHKVRNKLMDAGRGSSTLVCLARGYGLEQLHSAWLECLERES